MANRSPRASALSESISPVTPPKRFGWMAIVLALLLGLGAGAAGALAWVGSTSDDAMRQAQLAARQKLADSEARLVRAQAQVDVLTGRLAIEQSTRKGLEASLSTVQDELGRTRDQLAFFEQLLPPGPRGTIHIRALEITPSGPHLRFRVLLMRNGKDLEPFRGRMQFVASGTRDGKPVELPLRPVRASDINGVSPDTGVEDERDDGGVLALAFDEFQRAGGLLSLPHDFVPKKITLNILEEDQVRVTRSVELPEPPGGNGIVN